MGGRSESAKERARALAFSQPLLLSPLSISPASSLFVSPLRDFLSLRLSSPLGEDILDGTDLVVLGQMEDCKGTIDKTLWQCHLFTLQSLNANDGCTNSKTGRNSAYLVRTS
jgi:hypothetical protein